MVTNNVGSLKVGIVGAGIAGIATAIRLRAKGHEVDVYEANDFAGGKLSEISISGYRFDAGPSLFTLPYLVDELFILMGENPHDHFQYTQLEVACHYFYEDGTFLKAYHDRAKFLQEITIKTGESKASIEKVLDRSAYLYKYLSELFMFRSLHDPFTFLGKDAFKAYARLPKFDFFRSMHQANASSIQDSRLIQLFDRYATYNGSNPYITPATMNIIPHLEFGIGAYFPVKGMIDITNSLVALAQRNGVRFHFKSPVDRIIVKNKKAVAVQVANQEKLYDRVVSNMDISGTYRRLLPDQKAPEKLLKQPKSSSALIFYWGINRSFEQLDLHNIFFSADYRSEFDAIFNQKTIFHDPTIYVNITSKYQKTDAPDGCENWFVMINVPNNDGQDWDQLIAQSRKSIISKLNRLLDAELENHIKIETILEPRTIESRTGSAQGALYGNSSNSMFAAFLRHANFSKSIQNLYFCGGSVHPGGGIPMCLSSAKIVDKYFK